MIVKTYGGRYVIRRNSIGSRVPWAQGGHGMIAATRRRCDDGTIDVVVEIPRGSRNKYEYDHEHGRHASRPPPVLGHDRIPPTTGSSPTPSAEDGDPLDALVLLEDPTFPGCWVAVATRGHARDDRRGRARRQDHLRPSRRPAVGGHQGPHRPPGIVPAEIKHFFDVYKLIEPGKESTTGQFEGRRRRVGRDPGGARSSGQRSQLSALAAIRCRAHRARHARRAPPARGEAAVGAWARYSRPS